MILRISTEPIIIKTETYTYNKADWDLFKSILNGKININDLQNQNIQQLEHEIRDWVFNIKQAIIRTIPKTNYNTIYQIKPTSKINFLQLTLNYLKLYVTQNGWTPNNFILFQRLKTEMSEKCKQEFNKNLEKQIHNIIKDNKDTKVFWNNINRLRGRSNPQNNYLIDENGRKYHTDKEKCSLMKDTWSNIFRITEEEEQKFDRTNSEHIDTYINNRVQRTEHYESIDYSRLDEQCHFTRPIKEEEIIMAIKRLKNKAPGLSSINKSFRKSTKKGYPRPNKHIQCVLKYRIFPSIL